MTVPHVTKGSLIDADDQNFLIDTVNEAVEDIEELRSVSTAAPYSYDQVTPAATWSGSHNLNRYPRATVVVGGRMVLVDIEYPTLNTFAITFAEPTAGSVHFL